MPVTIYCVAEGSCLLVQLVSWFLSFETNIFKSSIIVSLGVLRLDEIIAFLTEGLKEACFSEFGSSLDICM